MAETFFKPSVGGKDVSVVTSTNAVVDPDLGATVSEMTTEINVSKLFPTGGVGGSNKYTLEGAIAKIPTKLRTVGIKCTFIANDNSVQTYVYQGGTYTNVDSWTQGTGGAGGGNMILEWNTDKATTRKQVKDKERKSGMQISYKSPADGWINEQYVGEKLTDIEWVKDENWTNDYISSNAIADALCEDVDYCPMNGKSANVDFAALADKYAEQKIFNAVKIPFFFEGDCTLNVYLYKDTSKPAYDFSDAGKYDEFLVAKSAGYNNRSRTFFFEKSIVVPKGDVLFMVLVGGEKYRKWKEGNLPMTSIGVSKSGTTITFQAHSMYKCTAPVLMISSPGTTIGGNDVVSSMFFSKKVYDAPLNHYEPSSVSVGSVGFYFKATEKCTINFLKSWMNVPSESGSYYTLFFHRSFLKSGFDKFTPFLEMSVFINGGNSEKTIYFNPISLQKGEILVVVISEFGGTQMDVSDITFFKPKELRGKEEAGIHGQLWHGSNDGWLLDGAYDYQQSDVIAGLDFLPGHIYRNDPIGKDSGADIEDTLADTTYVVEGVDKYMYSHDVTNSIDGKYRVELECDYGKWKGNHIVINKKTTTPGKSDNLRIMVWDDKNILVRKITKKLLFFAKDSVKKKANISIIGDSTTAMPAIASALQQEFIDNGISSELIPNFIGVSTQHYGKLPKANHEGRIGYTMADYVYNWSRYDNNPFNGPNHDEQFNYRYYLENLVASQLNGGNIDLWVVSLTHNDIGCYGNLLSYDKIKSAYDSHKKFIEEVLKLSPNCKFLFCLPPLEYFYGRNDNSYPFCAAARNFILARKAIIEMFDNNPQYIRGDVQRCYVADYGCALDPVYGFDRVLVDVSPWDDTKVEICKDPIHPSLKGGRQLARALFHSVCYVLSLMK